MTANSIHTAGMALLALGLALAGCGGGSGREDSAQATATAAFANAAERGSATLPTTAGRPLPFTGAPDAAPTDDRVRPLATSEPLSVDAVFDWAEWKYPDLFPKGPGNVQITHLGVTYTVRAYATGNYLGVTPGREVYGLGPFTANVLLPLGPISVWEILIRGDSCSVYPGSCGSNLPANPQLNECQPAALTALTQGTRAHAEMAYTGFLNGTQVLDMVVDGPSSYGGQATTQVTFTLQSSIAGQGVSTLVTKSQMQAVPGGLPQQLADETTFTSGSLTTLTRRVYDPPYVAREFTLARGAALTSTTSGSDVKVQPAGTTVRFSETKTFTFVTRETITVRGRSYDTCRYTQTQQGSSETTTLWYHVGSGLTVRVGVTGGGIELVSGSVNGVPI